MANLKRLFQKISKETADGQQFRKKNYMALYASYGLSRGHRRAKQIVREIISP